MVADAPGGGGGAPPRARPPLSADVDMREADLGSRCVSVCVRVIVCMCVPPFVRAPTHALGGWQV